MAHPGPISNPVDVHDDGTRPTTDPTLECLDNANRVETDVLE